MRCDEDAVSIKLTRLLNNLKEDDGDTKNDEAYWEKRRELVSNHLNKEGLDYEVLKMLSNTAKAVWQGEAASPDDLANLTVALANIAPFRDFIFLSIIEVMKGKFKT